VNEGHGPEAGAGGCAGAGLTKGRLGCPQEDPQQGSRGGLKNLNKIAERIMEEGISRVSTKDPTKVVYYMESLQYKGKNGRIKAPGVIWQDGVQSVQLMTKKYFEDF